MRGMRQGRWLGLLAVVALCFFGNSDLRGAPETKQLSPAELEANALAVSRAQLLLRSDPGNLRAQLQLGEAYYRAGQYPAARHHLNLFLAQCASGPDSVRAAHLEARSLLGSGLRLRATRALKTLVQQRGAPADAWHDFALLLREDDFPAQAIMAEMRALELHSVNQTYRREAASQWKEQRVFPQAILIFEQLRRSGQVGMADYFELGYLYQKLARYETARRYYESTLAEEPRHPEAHYNLALLDQRENSVDSAVYHLEEVLRIRPEYEPAYFELAQLFLGQERRLEAEQVFRRYLAVGKDSTALHEAKSLIEELQYLRLGGEEGGS